jgi:hypothetical protein
MRRLLVLISLTALLGIGTGCTHLAGVCDCEGAPGPQWVPPPPRPATAPPPVAPEAIKTMPKPNL